MSVIEKFITNFCGIASKPRLTSFINTNKIAQMATFASR